MSVIVLLQVIHLAYGVISGFCTLKLASQPEITSQIEIITCSLSDPCVLYNKQMVTPQRCHPGSSTASSHDCWCLTGKMQGWESSPHGSDSVKVALSFRLSKSCTEFFSVLPGWAGGIDQLLQSESFRGKHEWLSVLLVL